MEPINNNSNNNQQGQTGNTSSRQPAHNENRNRRRPFHSSNGQSGLNNSGGARQSRPSGGRPQFRDQQPSTATKVRRQVRRPMPAARIKQKAQPANIPTIAPGVIRIIPLGGVEEVGKNMTAIEIGEDIIVIDAGFQFKDELTPGIDYILPNTKYIEERKDKIRGIFITHGHLDHIGGLPFLIEKIGNPHIYSRQFGAIMIQKRHTEFPQLPKLNLTVLDGDETVVAGNIRVKTFPISHTIPDSMGLIIDTPHGDIVFIEDVRVDNIEGIPTEEEVSQYKRFHGKDALLLTMDSTSVEKPGWSLSESVVVDNIGKIIKDSTGRLIIATFASQVERILAILEFAEKYNKKVVVEGRSMKSNVEIVKQLNLIKATNVLIPMSEAESVPADRLIFLVTGAQGEEFAALMRMSNKSHKNVQLRPADTVLLSSSIIPGNHNAVTRLKDNLYRSEAKIITYLDSDIHASGHGNREELGWIHNQVNYKFFIPLHGNHYMLRLHAELAKKLGAPEENVIVPDNGAIIEIAADGKSIKKLAVRAPHDVVTIDGFTVSDIQEVVLRDRQSLSEAGIFVIVASLNVKTKKLKKSPDIISRGFIYLRESQDILHESRRRIKRIIETRAEKMNPVDFEELKKIVADDMTKYLFQQTAKSPLVIPVILGV